MSASQLMIQSIATSIQEGYWIWQLLIVSVMLAGIHFIDKRKRKCQKESH